MWLIVTPLFFYIDKRLNVLMQLLPALFLWWLLIGGLTTRNKRDQLLVMALIPVATACEVTASAVLHWYVYRLHNIPLWVPPGHGLLFLTVLITAEQKPFKTYPLAARVMATTGISLYGIWGIMSSQRDFTGAAFGLLLIFWVWCLGSYKGRFYVALWFWVSFMEIIGVTFGAWHWGAKMPGLKLHEGNPPSGVAGGYGIFDLLAFGVAALILRFNQLLRHIKSRTSGIVYTNLNTEPSAETMRQSD